jgi:hypothetical protein
LNLANTGYPDGALSGYYTKTGRKREGSDSFDGLAKFIVIELIETFEPRASREDQLETAAGCIRIAIEELESVLDVLENA